jgi:hypothetical protein
MDHGNKFHDPFENVSAKLRLGLISPVWERVPAVIRGRCVRHADDESRAFLHTGRKSSSRLSFEARS